MLIYKHFKGSSFLYFIYAARQFLKFQIRNEYQSILPIYVTGGTAYEEQVAEVFSVNSDKRRSYDGDSVKERVEDFLSLLMGQKVTILDILPSEENKLVEEYSILIMDMVVRLEDDSIVNLEIQKNGYMLPGQRSACYSADLLLRQYKRVRRKLKEDGKKMTYSNVKDVYTIVLFEKSPKELRDFHEVYQHHFKQTSDTGAEMELLQKYLFVTLDNYLEIKHNKGKKLGFGWGDANVFKRIT